MLKYLAGFKSRWAIAADFALLALFLLFLASHANVSGINQTFAGMIGGAPQAVYNAILNLFAVCFLGALFVNVCMISSHGPEAALESARDNGGSFGSDAGGGGYGHAGCGGADGACGGGE
ncbi:MAG: hypothetical protein ACOVVK_08595 [Elsteraceae bacterium]